MNTNNKKYQKKQPKPRKNGAPISGRSLSKSSHGWLDRFWTLQSLDHADLDSLILHSHTAWNCLWSVACIYNSCHDPMRCHLVVGLRFCSTWAGARWAVAQAPTSPAAHQAECFFLNKQFSLEEISRYVYILLYVYTVTQYIYIYIYICIRIYIQDKKQYCCQYNHTVFFCWSYIYCNVAICDCCCALNLASCLPDCLPGDFGWYVLMLGRLSLF